MSVKERFQATQVDEILGLPPEKWWDDVAEFDPEDVYKALQEAIGRLTVANIYEDENGQKRAASYWNYALGVLRSKNRPIVRFSVGEVRQYLDYLNELGATDNDAMVLEPSEDARLQYVFRFERAEAAA